MVFANNIRTESFVILSSFGRLRVVFSTFAFAKQVKHLLQLVSFSLSYESQQSGKL